MDTPAEPPAEQDEFLGVGVDTELRRRLSAMADEIGARNTRVAVAVPVRQILALFHDVYHTVPHVPDFDPEQEQIRWGGVGSFSPGEVPDPLPEVGVRLDDVEILIDFDPGYAPDLPPASLTLEQAEQFFLRGLSAVAEGKRRQARRPAVGVSDEEMARRGIIIESH